MPPINELRTIALVNQARSIMDQITLETPGDFTVIHTALEAIIKSNEDGIEPPSLDQRVKPLVDFLNGVNDEEKEDVIETIREKASEIDQMTVEDQLTWLRSHGRPETAVAPEAENDTLDANHVTWEEVHQALSTGNSQFRDFYRFDADPIVRGILDQIRYESTEDLEQIIVQLNEIVSATNTTELSQSVDSRLQTLINNINHDNGKEKVSIIGVLKKILEEFDGMTDHDKNAYVYRSQVYNPSSNSSVSAVDLVEGEVDSVALQLSSLSASPPIAEGSDDEHEVDDDQSVASESSDGNPEFWEDEGDIGLSNFPGVDHRALGG